MWSLLKSQDKKIEATQSFSPIQSTMDKFCDMINTDWICGTLLKFCSSNQIDSKCVWEKFS